MVKVRVMTSRPTTQRMTIEYAHTNTNLVISQNDLLLVEHFLSKREVMGSNPIVGMLGTHSEFDLDNMAAHCNSRGVELRQN